MLSIFKIFLNICLFRCGPQDLPASGFFLGFVLVANSLIGLILFSMQVPFQIALTQFLFSIAFLSGFSWMLLAIGGKTIRFKQTLTALLGADTVISLIALPFMIWLSVSHNVAIAYYILMATMLWSVAVVGHIIRHALSSGYLFGLGLSILYFIASFQATALVFS